MELTYPQYAKVPSNYCFYDKMRKIINGISSGQNGFWTTVGWSNSFCFIQARVYFVAKKICPKQVDIGNIPWFSKQLKNVFLKLFIKFSFNIDQTVSSYITTMNTVKLKGYILIASPPRIVIIFHKTIAALTIIIMEPEIVMYNIQVPFTRILHMTPAQLGQQGGE